MLFYIGVLIVTTAFLLALFVLASPSTATATVDDAFSMLPGISQLPIITANGQIINSVEDLDMQLMYLENQLEEKQKEVSAIKLSQDEVEERLEKLTNAANQVRMFYVKLKNDVLKGETEMNKLRCQIDNFKTRQQRLKDEVNENVKFYSGMLNNITKTEEYEIVDPLSYRNVLQ